MNHHLLLLVEHPTTDKIYFINIKACYSNFFPLSPFVPKVTFLYPLKLTENLRFSDIFQGVKECNIRGKMYKYINPPIPIPNDEKKST